MINNIYRQVGHEVQISKLSIEKMGITPEELDLVSSTLTDFTDAYNKSWRTFKVRQKMNSSEASLEFNKSLGILSPNETYNNGVDSPFLVFWNHDCKYPQKPIDIWFARGTTVTDSGKQKGLRIHYRKIGTMEHGLGKLSSDKISGEIEGYLTIDFNTQRIVPLHPLG